MNNETIPNCGGAMVLRYKDYSTEKDLKQAKKDCERLLKCLASASLQEVAETLKPYARNEV